MRGARAPLFYAVKVLQGGENSCVDKQGRGFGFKNYVVSNQNKRFNFAPLASKNWKASNLEILKFEARAPHSSGQILAGFLRLSFLNFLQMTRLVKAFYSKGSSLMGGLGEKVDNSTLKILNLSASLRFAS